MGSVIWVALGGAVGAVGRYGISLLPWKGAFPLLTLATNFLGAVAIGFLGGLFSQRLLGGVIVGLAGGGRLTADQTLFWKTGVCGGFTTFSTFSLEAVTLFQNGRYLLGGAYVLLSVALCVAGVLLGQCLARAVAHS